MIEPTLIDRLIDAWDADLIRQSEHPQLHSAIAAIKTALEEQRRFDIEWHDIQIIRLYVNGHATPFVCEKPHFEAAFILTANISNASWATIESSNCHLRAKRTSLKP